MKHTLAPDVIQRILSLTMFMNRDETIRWDEDFQDPKILKTIEGAVREFEQSIKTRMKVYEGEGEKYKEYEEQAWHDPVFNKKMEEVGDRTITDYHVFLWEQNFDRPEIVWIVVTPRINGVQQKSYKLAEIRDYGEKSCTLKFESSQAIPVEVLKELPAAFSSYEVGR